MTAQSEEPVYFWRPFEDNGYLGQWFTAPFTVPSPTDPITFQNCETYMMYHKALLFNDHTIAAEILFSTSDPQTVKALGRKVHNFDEKTWNANKYEIVLRANREKFKQNEKLRKVLLETGTRELVEASPMDRIWGIGFGKANAEKNRYRWGKNLLGKALMQVRRELMEEENKTTDGKKA